MKYLNVFYAFFEILGKWNGLPFFIVIQSNLLNVKTRGFHPMMLANTKEQDLVLHSIAVGLVAVKMFEKKFQSEWKNVIKSITGDAETKEYSLDNYKKVLFNAGLYHDVGKLDNNFQEYLKSKTAKKSDIEFDVQIEGNKKIDLNSYPLHQELSWAYLNLLTNSFKQKNIIYLNDLFLYSVYWHHAKFLRFQNTDFETVDKILSSDNFDLKGFAQNFNDFNEKAKQVVLKINTVNEVSIIDGIDVNDVSDASISNSSKIPSFQPILFRNGLDDDICLLKNAINHLTRAILVSADRVVSKLSKSDLAEIFESENIDNSMFISSLVDLIVDSNDFDLKNAVDLMLEKFAVKSENDLDNQKRSELQAKKVEDLSDKGMISVLQGPAGVGKTKMMVEWLGKINNKKRTYIITPKSNMVLELHKEFTETYLPNIDIEKITGAEKVRKINGEETVLEQQDCFKSSICITTIDQIMSLMMGHNKIDVYLDVLNSNLIFDEFHEFMDTPALLMLFIQTITLKKMASDGKCLLVSATPNPYLIKKLNLDFKEAVVSIETFNNKPYEIVPNYFVDSNKSLDSMNNDMFNPQKKGTICIFNTASKSQTSSLRALINGEENTLNFHSKFYSEDRKYIFKKIMKEFGKKKKEDSTLGTRDFVLRSGPILQASIDLSTNYMLTEISTIDNIYQRLGRVVRWAESDNGKYEIFIPSNIEVKNGSITKNLSSNGQYEIVFKFVEFLQNEIFIKSDIKLNDLYKAYFKFFEYADVIDAYDSTWSYLKKEANKIFSQSFEPIKIYAVNKKDGKVASKKSLRGGSLFGLACDLVSDGVSEKVIQPSEKFDTFGIEKRFTYTAEEELHLIDEMKIQIENNYSTKKYLEGIRNNYLAKIKNAKGKKKVKDLQNKRIIDLARYEETPIIFSYDGKSNLDDSEKRYNTIYKGLKIGILSYNKFKDVTK